MAPRFTRKEYFKGNTTYKEAFIEKDLRKIRTWLTHRFECPAKGFANGLELEEDEGRGTNLAFGFSGN